MKATTQPRRSDIGEGVEVDHRETHQSVLFPVGIAVAAAAGVLTVGLLLAQHPDLERGELSALPRLAIVALATIAVPWLVWRREGVASDRRWGRTVRAAAVSVVASGVIAGTVETTFGTEQRGSLAATIVVLWWSAGLWALALLHLHLTQRARG